MDTFVLLVAVHCYYLSLDLLRTDRSLFLTVYLVVGSIQTDEYRLRPFVLIIDLP
jgi:hypothetical protein